ncbi:MAG: MFS transporter [Anaerolineales bacterium]|jgi:GPH family glycoside/pentoside/hexuronide:cation symporter
MTARTAPAQPVKLSFWYKLVWGIGGLGTTTISGTFGALQPIFYQDYLGLVAKWIGIAATIYAIWNAVNDPLFGYITDSTRSKRGRRIPYMRFTAPFLALTFIAVWFAPPDASQLGLFWWMLVTMLLYDTCYTIIGLVYSALLPEITESDAERNGLQISYSLFALTGTMLGFLIPDIVRPKTVESDLWPLQLAMIVVGITCALLIIATTLKVKERPEFTKVDEPVKFGEAIRLTFSSRSFLVLVAANFMTILMQALLLGSIFYLADYVLKVDNVMVVLMALFIPLIIGVPVTTLIRARVGLVRAHQILLLVAGVGLVALAFVPPALILVCVALAGFGLSGPQTFTTILFGQVADEDEVRSGVRREGMFFGVNALITKPAQSVALVLIAQILARAEFITRESNQGVIFLDQPVSAIFGIKALVGLIPGTAMLLGALILQWYPLKGEYLEEIKGKVLEMHSQKHEKLVETME